MKKTLLTTLIFFLAVSVVSASTLYEYYDGHLPSISERAETYAVFFSDQYKGTATQNIKFLDILQNGLKLGATNSAPINGSTYNLAGSGITSSATSITLSTFTIPQSGYKIQDADNIGTTFYVTVEPGSRTKQEVISCTAHTQNVNGTATLSGCTRGLSPITPYTASTTLQFAHGGGTQVIFGDAAQLFNQYSSKSNDELVTGTWNFTGELPILSGTATATNQAATRAYVNSVTAQGVATTTFNTFGGSTLGTGAQAAAGTYTLNQPYLLSSAISTSTYFGNGSNKIIVTGSNNTIDPNFIATSSALVPNGYSWTASTTWSSNNNTFIGNVTFANPTTTITSATTTITGALQGPISYKATSTPDNFTLTNPLSDTNLFSQTVRGGTMSTGNIVRVRINVSTLTLNNPRVLTLKLKYGGTTVGSANFQNGTTGVTAGVGFIEGELIGGGTTGTQEGRISFVASTTPAMIATASNFVAGVGTASIDSTIDQTLAITAVFDSTDVIDTVGRVNAYMEVLKGSNNN